MADKEPQQIEIKLNDTKDWKALGKGSYGCVYLAKWDKRDVAVKEIENTSIRDQLKIENEKNQQARVRHPNVIELFGMLEDKYLVMEYAEDGTLHNLLYGRIKPAFTLSHAISWGLQCAEGVEYMHGMKPKPLIHRDLKPLNLLLCNKGRTLKICDFGTVADKSTWMTAGRGTDKWMAPEVLVITRMGTDNKKAISNYTEKCDVYSWSIVQWEVFAREQPFSNLNGLSIEEAVPNGVRPPRERCPPDTQELITSCWDKDPTKRPTMPEVVVKMTALINKYPDADAPIDLESSMEEAEQKEFDNEDILFEDIKNRKRELLEIQDDNRKAAANHY